jgi:hypothetical protein
MNQEYTMFRRLLLTAVMTLALLGGFGRAHAQRPAPAKAATVASKYAVEYRRSGQITWTRYASYDSYQTAQAAAQGLHRKGYEVQVLATTPRKDVPPRPRAGTLPTTDTLTSTQVLKVFRWMASQRDIAFAYPVDGCYARTHLMIQRMQKIGLKPFKVWSFANGNESLYVRTGNHPTGHVTWKYHVAPIVRVRRNDGQQKWYVLDPALFKAPASIKAWRNAQVRQGAKVLPYVTWTRLGDAPVDINGRKLPGTGYWPGHDPKEGADAHAVKMMRLYKPYEGREAPKVLGAAPRTPSLWPAGPALGAALDDRRRAA